MRIFSTQIFLFIITSLLSINTALCSLKASSAEQKNIINQNAELKQERFENLQLLGNCSFDRLSVQYNLDVSGNLSGKKLYVADALVKGNAEIKYGQASNIIIYGSFKGEYIFIENDLTVLGSSEVKNVTIGGKAIINGCGRFYKVALANLELSGNAKLSNASVRNIVIKGDKETRLTLTSTEVLGDITFESGKGKIYSSGPSRIFGKIIGGKIVK